MKIWKLLGLLALAACGGEKMVGATQVLVVVNSDLALGRMLTNIKVSVQNTDGTETVGEPFPFAVAEQESAGKFKLPLSFGINKPANGANSFRVVVAGYGPLGAGGSEVKVIEQKALASFQARSTLRLSVFLGSVCFQKLCDGPVGQDQICYPTAQGRISAGDCGPVPSAALDRVEPSKELVPTDGDGGRDAGTKDAGARDAAVQQPEPDAAQGQPADAGITPPEVEAGTPLVPDAGTPMTVVDSGQPPVALDCFDGTPSVMSEFLNRCTSSTVASTRATYVPSLLLSPTGGVLPL